jgi:hypothetical protein
VFLSILTIFLNTKELSGGKADYPPIPFFNILNGIILADGGFSIYWIIALLYLEGVNFA